jgi:hypothetical protein
MEKRVFKEGDKGKALHHELGRVVEITYKILPEYVTIEGWVVRDALFGVCDETGEVLLIPPDTPKAIRAARLEYEAAQQREAARV